MREVVNDPDLYDQDLFEWAESNRALPAAVYGDSEQIEAATLISNDNTQELSFCFSSEDTGNYASGGMEPYNKPDDRSYVRVPGKGERLIHMPEWGDPYVIIGGQRVCIFHENGLFFLAQEA